MIQPGEHERCYDLRWEMGRRTASCLSLNQKGSEKENVKRESEENPTG